MWTRSAAVTVALVPLLLAAPGHALDQPIDAVKLVLRQTPSGERLTFVSRDPDFLFPPLGSADDPATGMPGGVLVELFAASGGRASLAASPGLGTPGWSVTTSPAARFLFRNPQGSGEPSPLRVVVLKEGSTLKLSARATGLPLTGPQMTVGIRITTGTRRSCALFAAPTIRRDEVGSFVARGALASSLTDCSEASLGLLPCQLFFDPLEPMCGGVCPSGQVCVGELSAQIGVSCLCYPEGVTPCLGSGYPQCGGSCTGGLQCQAFRVTSTEGPIDLRECACVDPGDICADPPGTCFAVGVCPAGEVCMGQGPPTSACGCAAP